jgi:hypothetical protein
MWYQKGIFPALLYNRSLAAGSGLEKPGSWPPLCVFNFHTTPEYISNRPQHPTLARLNAALHCKPSYPLSPIFVCAMTLSPTCASRQQVVDQKENREKEKRDTCRQSICVCGVKKRHERAKKKKRKGNKITHEGS